MTSRILPPALEPFRTVIHRIETYFGLPHRTVYLVSPGVHDIASIPGGNPPRILVGGVWMRSSDWEAKAKKILHENLHIWGLGHTDKERRVGYFSSPRRDRLSWEVWNDFLRNSRFRPEKFGFVRDREMDHGVTSNPANTYSNSPHRVTKLPLVDRARAAARRTGEWIYIIRDETAHSWFTFGDADYAGELLDKGHYAITLEVSPTGEVTRSPAEEIRDREDHNPASNPSPTGYWWRLIPSRYGVSRYRSTRSEAQELADQVSSKPPYPETRVIQYKGWYTVQERPRPWKGD